MPSSHVISLLWPEKIQKLLQDPTATLSSYQARHSIPNSKLRSTISDNLLSHYFVHITDFQKVQYIPYCNFRICLTHLNLSQANLVSLIGPLNIPLCLAHHHFSSLISPPQHLFTNFIFLILSTLSSLLYIPNFSQFSRKIIELKC